MDRAPPVVLALLLAAAVSGCLGGGRSADTSDEAFPPGWDETAPDASELASNPYYELTQSSSFLLKGQTYGRYIVHVPQTLRNTHLFFSTGQGADGYATEADQPRAQGPDANAAEHHYEFLQVRPLGRSYRTANINAEAEFGHAGAPGTFTLTYLYGKGHNHPFLAPYEGDPRDWTWEAGWYEFVLATDEAVTVGVNVHTGSDFWTTHYNPQELGTSRAESLNYHAEVRTTMGGKLPDLDLSHGDLVRARAGETLYYFAFADVWYETHSFALDAAGLATVSVDGAETPHRLSVSTPGPSTAEAYAFAINFNAPGPLRETLRVKSTFQEMGSAQSTVGVLALLFAVATEATQTHEGLEELPA